MSPPPVETIEEPRIFHPQIEELTGVLSALAALRKLGTDRRPPLGDHDLVHKLAIWVTNTLYQLELIDISPGGYWQTIDGWVLLIPPPYGQSQVIITVRVTNRSNQPLSGTFVAHLDNNVLHAQQTKSTVTSLAPGESADCEFYLYNSLTGSILGLATIRQFTAQFQGASSTGAFTSFWSSQDFVDTA